jgi:imidazolonepropionase-like amidohydrolase
MTTTITGVRVFDGERMTSHTAVRLAHGLIEAVGHDLPADSSIDGHGATLMPGLIDAHVHLLPGAPRQALTFGVTTLLDMFSKPELLRSLNGGADVRSSSIGATAPGGHPSMMYAPFPTVTGPQDAAQFVADRVAEGATHLKVLYDDGRGGGPMLMPSLDVPTVAALVSAAHDTGLLVAAHVSTAKAAMDLLPTGVDVFAHVPFDALSDADVEAIASAGVAVIATLAISDGFPGDEGMPLLASSLRLGPAWSAVVSAQGSRWMPPELPDFSPGIHNVYKLCAAGVPVLAGTDAPNPGTVHGASVHRELEHLVAAGLTPVQALNAATARTADVFGLTDRGRVSAGLRADLLLVDGRPDERIADSQRIRAVWHGGERVDLDSYIGSADEQAGLAMLRAQTERVVAAARSWLAAPVAIRREDDDELLGYLLRTGDAWLPMTVFHVALGAPTSEQEAEEIVRRDGLASLSEPWWLEDAGEWREVRLQEAQPHRIRFRWADPTADQPAHGQWIDVRQRRLRR